MLKVIRNKNWNDILDKLFPHNDIYFRYEYVNLWAKYYDCIPEAIVWDEDSIIFWTHLVCDKKIDFNTEKFDMTTPYGYGGYLTTGDITRFMIEYNKIYKDKSEFIRFHPAYDSWKYFKDAKYINDIASIDLHKEISIKKGHRYNIRKAKERGCYVDIIDEPTNDNIDAFIDVYYQSSLKNKLRDFYYFSSEFIRSHFEDLSSILIEAKYKDKVIGSSIFMYGNKFMHYHLCGSNYDYRNYYPVDLILNEAINYAKEHNYEKFILGGGRGKNDSLFKFKTGFSNEILPFYIGKI